MEAEEQETYTVMIVEDEQFQRDNIYGLIMDSANVPGGPQMTALSMSNGVQAKNHLLENVDAKIDLILLDYNMPVMDGLEFLDWLREIQEFKHIVVVMMSTKEELQNLHYCMKQGATTYFLKPLNRQNALSLPKLIMEKRKQEPVNDIKRIYEVRRRLGSGGNATVDLVYEKTSQKEYARKQIFISGNDDSVLKQAKNEVSLFKVLDSPFIIKYIDSYSRGNNLYIIMEYAKNGELAEMIKKKASIGEKFPQKQIVKWLTQTALGLAIMHSKYIMHRDLKPQNLFLTEEFDLKLGDFGISKEMKTADRMTSTFCGTPYYMPPEVYRQESYSLEADIWALGCAFYETMTLAPPFEMSNNPGDKQQNLGDKILHGDPSPPLSPMYSEPLRKLVLSMLNKAPNDRPTILEILRSDVIDECITSMIKEKPEIEAHIKEFVNLNSKPKKNPKTGVSALGLAPVESLDAEKSEKYPEYILAEMLKTLELKTIKNGFLSKFYNAFTGEDFKEAFSGVKCAKDVNYDNWCVFLLKSKILLPLKGGQTKMEKDGIYSLAYVQEKPQRNDMFDGDEQPGEEINRTISDLIISGNEIVKIYKESYKDKDIDFNPFTIPDFLYYLRKSARLKKADLVGFNKNERFCYLLNCFQIMSFYRICMETAGKSAAGGSLLSYVGLGKSGSYSFKLGTESYMNFTADDILHGVLRKNTKKYSAYFAQFKGGDPRSTLLSFFDKRIISFYYLEHCELQDANLEKLEALSVETKLTTLLKNWVTNNLYYNAVEKSINLPAYLDSNYLADYNNSEFEMVLDVGYIN
jgi:NIMA (never in mitosis gene a)-related kinase 1/4/5